MRVIMFQPQFVPQIEAGTKRSTIRPRARCKPGDELSLRQWTGKPYRSKQREIMCRPRCKAVNDIRINNGTVSVNGMVLHGKEESELARCDGFADFVAMRDWFEKTHGLPFSGELIEW